MINELHLHLIVILVEGKEVGPIQILSHVLKSKVNIVNIPVTTAFIKFNSFCSHKTDLLLDSFVNR